MAGERKYHFFEKQPSDVHFSKDEKLMLGDDVVKLLFTEEGCVSKDVEVALKEGIFTKHLLMHVSEKNESWDVANALDLLLTPECREAFKVINEKLKVPKNENDVFFVDSATHFRPAQIAHSHIFLSGKGLMEERVHAWMKIYDECQKSEQEHLGTVKAVNAAAAKFRSR